MLRGVNKRIIEINDTGSDYFEKAVFFVKTSVNESSSALQKEADRIISEYLSSDYVPRQGYLRYTENRKIKKKRTKQQLFLCLFCSVISIALTVTLIKLLF